MGGLIVESSGSATHTQEIQVENGLKDSTKKKRRIRRKRSKKNHSPSGSVEAQEALSVTALKHIPCSEKLSATDKLYIWALLKKNKILYSEARVLVLGPRFMSVYIPKLTIERRIYYDEVEGLTVEWLDATSTLLISQSMHDRPNKNSSPSKFRPLYEIAVIVSPIDTKLGMNVSGEDGGGSFGYGGNLEPSFFPLTVHPLSTIPVALHAIGRGDGPLDIVARLYISSYF